MGTRSYIALQIEEDEYGEKKYAEKYGDIWEVPVTLPTDTHAAYPMGLCADLGVEKTGGFN